MVNIVLNDDIKINLVGNFNPINFNYNLTSKRFGRYEGELIFKDILNSININNSLNIKSIKLVGEKDEIDISNFINYYLTLSNNNNTFKLILKYENIFNIFHILTTFFNDEFEPSLQTYDCFSTSMNCNLECSYCVYSCKSNIKYPFLPIKLGDYFIKGIRNIINKVCFPKFNVVRIMGGETLINLNDFKSVLSYIKDNFNIIDDIWIYTNLTINVEGFLEIIEKEIKSDKIKKVTIIFTSDSLDYKKSERIKKEKIMFKYIQNISKVINYFKHNDKILIASNLMYTKYDETLKTALQLYNMGVEFIQISYDEFSGMDKSYIIKNDISKIYNEIEMNGIRRLKPNLSNVMWYHFFISIDDTDIYQCKFSFKSNYIIAQLNNY